MSRGYLGSWIEEVIAITPACDLMAGEHSREAVSACGFRGFQDGWSATRKLSRNGYLGSLSRRPCGLEVRDSGSSRLCTMLAITSFIIHYLGW